MASPSRVDPRDQLIRNGEAVYGERFHDHLLEQYKLYVDSAQKVSEKRISASNYLLTVSSSLLTLFGIVVTQMTGAWLIIIPVAGLLVSLAWFSMVRSYKDLNSAKFRVIHELEEHLPAALFAYEWHHCEHGMGKAYRPITHIERWIPGIFAVVYLGLAVLILAGIAPKKDTPKSQVVSGTLDVNVKPPVLQLQPQPQQSENPAPNRPAATHRRKNP
ncbi:MAG TPA: hypothetical protein VF283_18360 [Bryobacteraceae bacterium]